MTKRERVETAYGFGLPDRPPFVPAVYEHKAALVGRSPSEVCRNRALLGQALLRELEIYDPDALTVGVDVYNVEAEALGCPVRYFEDSNDVPAVASPLLREARGVEALEVPDPERDGRMPLFLEAAQRVMNDKGKDIVVRGALTGPFSLACALLGTEQVLIGTADDPASIARLLEFCGRVTVAYGRAFRARGAGVVIFDSKASPGAASPRVFRDLVMPVYRDLVMPSLAAAGARRVPLIIGGDTTSILEDILRTGAGQLLCDAGADLEVFKRRCREEKRSFRVSVDARLVHRGTPAEIKAEALRLLDATRGQPGLLFGCGVVAYDTPPENVLALRSALEEY
ncbi:MAG: uroporphyrinogen decarboxylase family protein [Acidobacteriota bacterium]